MNWIDEMLVVSDYLTAKDAAKILQEKQLKEFWDEYDRETQCTGGS